MIKAQPSPRFLHGDQFNSLTLGRGDITVLVVFHLMLHFLFTIA